MKKSAKSRKLAITGLTLSAVLASSRLTIPLNAHAATNQYEWTKLDETDPLGGDYESAASSASGQHLILAVEDGGEGSPGDGDPSPLFISDDYGATWENVADDIDPGIRNYWQSVDISEDGQTMVAVSNYTIELEELNSGGGQVFVSTDAGANWANVSPETEDEIDDWQDVAIAGDGSRIAAVAWDADNSVYISDNEGESWANTAIDDAQNLKSVSISADGEKILVGGETDGEDPFVALSDDGGDEWTDITPDDRELSFETQTTMSADGETIGVSIYGWDGDADFDAVYVSDSDGDEWDDVTPEDDLERVLTIGLSGNGQVLAIGDDFGHVQISTDLGASWNVEEPDEPEHDNNYYDDIDMNETGSRVITAAHNNAYLGYNSFLDNSTELDNAEDNQPVVITLPSGTTLTCSSAVKESALDASDGTYTYPVGLVNFCFSGADENNQVTLTFVTDLKADEVVVRKYNPDTEKYATITEAEISETTFETRPALQVTYNIADNGPLDLDPDDGEVADPVGLAVLAASTVTAPNTGAGTPSSTPIAALVAITVGAVTLTAPVTRKLANKASKK